MEGPHTQRGKDLMLELELLSLQDHNPDNCPCGKCGTITRAADRLRELREELEGLRADRLERRRND
jgi:hypothetical protein